MRVIHISFDENTPSDVALSLVKATIAYGERPNEDYYPIKNQFSSGRVVTWTTQDDSSYFTVSK